MEFRGKKRILKNRTVIEAYNHATNMNFFYSFEEDFFWMTNCELPEWKIRI
jgi:hypothetical protein